MAISGNDGAVAIGSNEIAEVKSFSFEESAEAQDSTVLGTDFKSGITTLKSASGTIECLYNPSDTNGQNLLTVGTQVSVKLFLEGNTSGKEKIEATVNITNVTNGASVGEILTKNITFETTGQYTKATI